MTRVALACQYKRDVVDTSQPVNRVSVPPWDAPSGCVAVDVGCSEMPIYPAPISSPSNLLALLGKPDYTRRTLSALRGNLTFARFYVIGDIPDDIPGTTLKRIRANAFQPLSPDDDKSEGVGWANVDDPFDTDLDHEKVFYNEYVCLGMRLDRWAIPGPLLKAHLRDAEQALLEKRGLERLGRQAKADLKTMVVRKLRRQLVPALKCYDVVWNLNSNIVHFHSQSERITTLFDDLFKKTFKLDLVPESPGTAAERIGLDQRQSAAFAGLEPMSLARLEES